MQILKSTVLSKRKCEFGNFELKVDEGWKISQSFIDYESSLLVICTSDENDKNWEDTGFGGRSIPTKQYIINVEISEILLSEQWSKWFSYKRKEFVSEDDKYKLIFNRIHEPERNTDGIKEELIELESGKTISTSSRIAFSSKKEDNLLESFYKRRQEEEERISQIDAMPTLEEHFANELKKIIDHDTILDYYNENEIFKLIFIDNNFVLSKITTKWKYGLDLNNLEYEIYRVYENLEGFKNEFLLDKNWYLTHSPFINSLEKGNNSHLLKRLVVEFFNDLRYRHNFSFKEYDELNNWENFFYKKDSIKPSEYKQYCSNCNKLVGYDPRYPKYICNDCSSKKIVDENGIEISFSNIGFSGGLRITYKKGKNILKEDVTQIEKLCFIDGKRFIATEARFGGIVIQTEK